MIEWKDEYELGIASADYEHRKLVELVNELHDQAMKAESPAAAAAVLSHVVFHFTAHFSVEERVMADNGYPRLDGHRADHRRLLESIDARLEALNRGAPAVKEIAEDIELWLVEHLHNWDMDLYIALDRII